MRRGRAVAALVTCAAAPVLWMSQAAADEYPPTGPGGGGGGAVTVPVTAGGGEVSLPRTGQDLVTPVEVGAASLLAGVALLVAAQVRRPASARRRG